MFSGVFLLFYFGILWAFSIKIPQTFFSSTALLFITCIPTSIGWKEIGPHMTPPILELSCCDLTLAAKELHMVSRVGPIQPRDGKQQRHQGAYNLVSAAG